MGVVENVAGGQAQVQGPGFADGNGLVYGHVEGDLPRPFDDVAPSVSEGRACGVRTSGTGGAKRGGIEPFKRCGLAERDGLTCYRVGKPTTRSEEHTSELQSRRD